MLKIHMKQNINFIFNKWESTALRHLNDSKVFIEDSNDIDDVYKNIEECNSSKKLKILIVFDDMIADMLSNEKLDPIVNVLLISGRKLNISLVFIKESYFAMPKNIRLNSLQYSIMKTPNKQELQNIAINHLSDIDFKDFMNLYKNVLQNHITF